MQGAGCWGFGGWGSGFGDKRVRIQVVGFTRALKFRLQVLAVRALVSVGWM